MPRLKAQPLPLVRLDGPIAPCPVRNLTRGRTGVSRGALREWRREDGKGSGGWASPLAVSKRRAGEHVTRVPGVAYLLEPPSNHWLGNDLLFAAARGRIGALVVLCCVREMRNKLLKP